MHNSCCGVARQHQSPQLEVTEKEISNAYRGEFEKYSYPRHVSRYQTKSHRHYGKIVYNTPSLPKTCQLSSSEVQSQETVDTAWGILHSQLNNEQTQKIHLDNLRRNLERRLQAAKANGNDYLIDLLEAESKHLEMNI